jgi:putative tryptophan/tyrosine transport system substrate-binding protein
MNPKSKIQNLKFLSVGAMLLALCSVSALLAALCLPAQAQETKNLPVIGYLSPFSPASEAVRPTFDSFHGGLRELGWIPGKNVAVEYRWAEENYSRLSELANELVSLNVNVIYATASTAALTVKRATASIPVVFVILGDPLSFGLVADLARPGANITGIGGDSPELGGKRLELLKELVPAATHVAVLVNPANAMTAPTIREATAAAKILGVRLQVVEVREAEKLEGAFAAMTKQRAEALMVLQDPVFFGQAKQVLALVHKNRLPAVYVETGWVAAGGLLSYAPSRSDLHRRAAYYIDKILKGSKPSELPVERPTKFELMINLKAAKQIKLTIPPSVLARADKVMK